MNAPAAKDTRVTEAMLLGWTDNQTGRKVTFLLPDETGDHPFKGLKCGPAHGQRLALSVALIDDDETAEPVTEPADEPTGKRPGSQHEPRPVAGCKAEPRQGTVQNPGRDSRERPATYSETTDMGAHSGIREGEAAHNCTALTGVTRGQVPDEPFESAGASVVAGRSRPVPDEVQQLVDDPVRQSVDCWRLCDAPDFRRYLKAEYEDVWRKTMRDADMSINKFAGAVVSNLCSTHTRAAFDYHGEPRRLWMSLRTMYGYWRTAQGLDRDSAEQRMGEAEG